MNTKEKTLKLKKASAKLAHDFYVKCHHKEIEKWDSSAQNLENALRKHGLTPPCKLYYEYKFPGNQKNFEFDKTTKDVLEFIATYENYFNFFAPDDIKKRLLSSRTPNICDLSAFFGFCICLALSDIKDIKAHFNQTYMSCKAQLNEIAEQIWQLNPELQHIKDYKDVDFVAGATYGFAPAEIDFYLKRNQRLKTCNNDYELDDIAKEENNITKNWREIAFFTLEHPGYVLAPETGDLIVKAIHNYLRENPRSKKIERQATKYIQHMYER